MIWSGRYWALVTSAFVHVALWHLAFNVYWLWVLGRRLEQAIGSLPFLAFFTVAAFVSSSFQLAVSDDTGIGASGVVYAIFGFMWPARHRYPGFERVLDRRTIQLFVIWLIGCVVVTRLEVWQIGNAAHVSGLVFGAVVAGLLVLGIRRRLLVAGLATLLVLSIMPLFWCPWSVTWIGTKAYQAHAAGRYEVALERYTRLLETDPENAWGYLNRSLVYQELGQTNQAEADRQKARDLDLSIESQE